MYTEEEVLKDALEKNGFSTVKFPGGGGDERRHTSTVVMWCLIGEKLVLVLLPHRHIHPSLVIPEIEFHTRNETSTDTAVREVQEETGIYLNRETLHKYFEHEYEKDGHAFKKYFFTARVNMEVIESLPDIIRDSLVEKDSGQPVAVTFPALASFLKNEKSLSGTYAKVALRYAFEKIHEEIPENIGSKYYSQVAGFPGKRELKRFFNVLV